jgi:diguanylate cyclase (GGDEF)-like protein/PAS domain S-box-containing protein
MICTLDLEGRIDGWNTSGERLLGYSHEEVRGKPLSVLAAGADEAAPAPSAPPPWLARAASDGWCDIDGWNTRRNGSRFWGDGVVSALRDAQGAVFGYSVLLRDMTERRLAVERLQDLATKDPLTGLANRRHFFEQAERELGLSVRHGYPMSILMIDADHFKRINDAHGHPVGDEVLRRLASTLRQQLRTTDLPARYGGEELVVLLPSTSAAGAMILAERIRVAVRECELAVGDLRVTWTVSIGIADVRRGERTVDAIIERADAALYAAKAAGRDRTHAAALGD